MITDIDLVGTDGKIWNVLRCNIDQDDIDIVPFPPGHPQRVFKTEIDGSIRHYIVVDQPTK